MYSIAMKHHVARLADVVDRDDVGVVQAAGGARLLVEALLVLVGAVALERHVDGLHRHRALEHRVGRLVDDAHGAAAELGLDDVAAELGLAPSRPPDLAAGLDRAEDRSPDRVPGLGRRELERRIDGERLAELVAALALAVGGAVDEGEMLVRVGALLVGQALARARPARFFADSSYSPASYCFSASLNGVRGWRLDRSENRAPRRDARPPPARARGPGSRASALRNSSRQARSRRERNG